MSKINKEKSLLTSTINKLVRSRDFGSNCNLDSQESKVLLTILTETAIRVAKIKEKLDEY